MANVNSLTSNSYSSSTSLYGNRNVLTGLASGMDTEAMIQNSVTGYQTKIQELQQSQEKLEWKQDAYREIIDQMYGITNKYTSYTSTTNLSSNTFFTSNVSTTANGTNAAAISATGKATSDIQINAVTQLATAARYAVDSGALNFNGAVNLTGSAISGTGTKAASLITGSLTLRLGNTNYALDFGANDVYADTKDENGNVTKSAAQALVDGINEKLKEQKVDVEATLNNGKITFAATGEAASKGDSVYISGSTGNFRSVLGVKSASSSAAENRFDFNSIDVGETNLSEEQSMAKYLSNKTVTVTLNGANKKISIGALTEPDPAALQAYDDQIAEIEAQIEALGSTIDDNMTKASLNQQISDLQKAKSAAASKDLADQIVTNLQANLNKEFGDGAVTVSADNEGKLTFGVKAGTGSSLLVDSDIDELGIKGLSNYFNTSKTLGSLLGDDYFKVESAYHVGDEGVTRLNGVKDDSGKQVYSYTRTGENGETTTYRFNEDGYQVDKDNKVVYEAKDLVVNGETIGSFTKDQALEKIMTSINSNVNAGVKVNFSKLTGEFVFTASNTGAGGKIEFGDGLASRLFGGGAANEKSLEDVFGADFFDEDGNATIYYGTANLSLGSFSKDSTVQDIVDALQAKGTRMTVSYYANTNSFAIANAGSTSYFSSSANTSKQVMYNNVFVNGVGGYAAGQDAVVKATVNGKELELTRSSNVIEMDGLSVTLKDEFSAYGEDGKVNKNDAVTFKTSADSDKIVDAIKSFVEDVNKLMTSVHSAVTTQPLTKSTSSGKGSSYSHKSGYEPLTEDDKNSMSEDAVKKYEEKAKTGLLFGDTDLRTLYDKLLTGIQSYGTDRIDMEAIGLTTAYSNGATTLQLNEEKLRAALDSDPDKVRNVFTKTKEGGSATEGLMSTLKSTLNAYGSTSLASPGILVRKAGTKLSAVSLLNNNIQSQISGLDSQIESWQTKLSNRIDYYTKQFTQLEQLMSTMNNQSSMLADLMGY